MPKQKQATTPPSKNRYDPAWDHFTTRDFDEACCGRLGRISRMG